MTSKGNRAVGAVTSGARPSRYKDTSEQRPLFQTNALSRTIIPPLGAGL